VVRVEPKSIDQDETPKVPSEPPRAILKSTALSKKISSALISKPTEKSLVPAEKPRAIIKSIPPEIKVEPEPVLSPPIEEPSRPEKSKGIRRRRSRSLSDVSRNPGERELREPPRAVVPYNQPMPFPSLSIREHWQLWGKYLTLLPFLGIAWVFLNWTTVGPFVVCYWNEFNFAFFQVLDDIISVFTVKPS
jgi:hypothetical protein